MFQCCPKSWLRISDGENKLLFHVFIRIAIISFVVFFFSFFFLFPCQWRLLIWRTNPRFHHTFTSCRNILRHLVAVKIRWGSRVVHFAISDPLRIIIIPIERPQLAMISTTWSQSVVPAGRIIIASRRCSIRWYQVGEATEVCIDMAMAQTKVLQTTHFDMWICWWNFQRALWFWAHNGWIGMWVFKWGLKERLDWENWVLHVHVQ